jgi:transcription elongation factor GreA
MTKVTYYTAEGMKKLQDELDYLKSTGRALISAQIAEARDKGDLSENAEYDAAKDAQGMLEMKISNLEGLLRVARIVDEKKIDTSKVMICSIVKIRNIKTKAVMKYTLVSEKEADLKAGKISVSSPIGMSLIGKKLGDKVDVEAPAGTIKLEIIEISR